jgi:hypothetical protein
MENIGVRCISNPTRLIMNLHLISRRYHPQHIKVSLDNMKADLLQLSDLDVTLY